VAVTMDRQRVYTTPVCDALVQFVAPGTKKRDWQDAARAAGMTFSALARQALDREAERIRAQEAR
jgi:hypothetical protein